MKFIIPSVYLALTVVVFAVITARPSGPYVLAVTSPVAYVAGSMAVIDRADGAFVSAGSPHWMSGAYSQAPDCPTRPLKANALLVINHDLALGCLQGMDT